MISIVKAVELTDPRLSRSQLTRHAAAGTLRAVMEDGRWRTTEEAVAEFNAQPRRSGPKGTRKHGELREGKP